MIKCVRLYVYEVVFIQLVLVTAIHAVGGARVFTKADLEDVVGIQKLLCTDRRSCHSGEHSEDIRTPVNATAYQHLIHVDIPEYTFGTCCSECSCDKETCMFDGTCCPDIFDHVPTVEESHARIKASCEYVNFMGVSDPYHRPRGNPKHMTRKCPDDYKGSSFQAETKDKCENPTRYNVIEETIPVTDITTNLVYQNVHCSVCYGVPPEQLVYWDAYAACKDKGDETQLYSAKDNIVDIIKQSSSCNFIYEPSDLIRNRTIGCRYVTKTCNETGLWKTYDHLVEAACHAYSSVYDFKYQNIFCAMCNQEDIVGDCNDIGPFDFPPSFSVLLNFDVKQPAAAEVQPPGVPMCMPSQVLDKLTNVCRNLHCRFPKTLSGKECVNSIESVTGGTYKMYLKLTPDRRVSVLSLGHVQHILQVHVDDLLQKWGIKQFVYNYNIYFKDEQRVQENAVTPDPISSNTEIEDDNSKMTPQSLFNPLLSSVGPVTPPPPPPPPFNPPPLPLTSPPYGTTLPVTPSSEALSRVTRPSSHAPSPSGTASPMQGKTVSASDVVPPPQAHPPPFEPMTDHTETSSSTATPYTTAPSYPGVFLTPPKPPPPRFTLGTPPTRPQPSAEAVNASESPDLLKQLEEMLPGIEYFLFYIKFYFLPSAGKQNVTILDEILNINGESVYLSNTMIRFEAWFNYSLEDYGHSGDDDIPVLVDTHDNVTLEIIPKQVRVYNFVPPIGIDTSRLSPDVLADKSRCPLLNVQELDLDVERVSEGLRVTNINTTLPMKYVYEIEENGSDVNYYICSDVYLPISEQFADPFLQHIDNTTTVVERDKDLPQRILSLVCTSLSILCSALTLTTYMMFKELRTQPGINNMSLIVCLIVAQLLFQFGLGAAEDVSELACMIIGIFIHFSWLLVVSWMTICSYHMFRVFINTFERRNQNGKTGTTILYWVLTSLAASVFVATNVLVSFFTSDKSDYGYSTSNCYISQPYMIGYVFALPVGVFVLTNLILFLIVIVTVSKQPTVHSDSKAGRNYVKIYAKLSTITGLTWTFGFIFTFTGISTFEYIFVIMNASQGVFIFLAFVLNRRVVNLYKTRFVKRSSSEVYKISGGTRHITISSN